MKKTSSGLSQATASHDVDASDDLSLEVPGVDVAAFNGGATALQGNDPELFPSELPDRTMCEREDELRDYKAKHPRGPIKGTDEGLELSYPPGVLPDSSVLLTEAPNTMSIPKAVSSRQPGAEHVSGMLQTTLSAHDIDGDANLPIETGDESMNHHLVATLVEPAPIAEVISDSEIKAANQPRSHKRLWIGGLVCVVAVVSTILAVILTRRDPDPSNQLLEALNPVLLDSSKDAIKKVDTPVSGIPMVKEARWSGITFR